MSAHDGPPDGEPRDHDRRPTAGLPRRHGPSGRADARRNRAAILAAAARVVDRDGADRLRVADVARAAGVGPGSVYRAFGSRSGLLLGLLDEHERALQDAIVHGDPPLGPGSRAADRLLAFVGAVHELAVRERAVLLAADQGSGLARHHTGAHGAWRLHLALLLRELRPEADADVLAELLLAPLAAGVQVHLVDERGVAPERIRAEVDRLARLVTGGPSGRDRPRLASRP